MGWKDDGRDPYKYAKRNNYDELLKRQRNIPIPTDTSEASRAFSNPGTDLRPESKPRNIPGIPKRKGGR